MVYCFLILFGYFGRAKINKINYYLMFKKFAPFLMPLVLVMIISIAPTNSFSQRKNNTQSSAQINGEDGILLRVDVEYAVNKKKVLVNDKYIEYTVTNIGSVTYNGTLAGKKNALVFDLTTKDGKVIEKTVSFIEPLSPGKSTVIKYFIADVGPKASCVAVKPSRLDFWSNN